MPKIHIVTNEGELVESIEITEDYNFDKVYARMSLGAEVADAILKARNMEQKDATSKKGND